MPIGVVRSRDVVIQSSHSRLFRYYLMNELKTDITTTAIVSPGDDVINVSAGHGFTATVGEALVLKYGEYDFQSVVKSVSVNAITIETSVFEEFPIGTTVFRGNTHINLFSGSVTPVTFKSSLAGLTVPIDISYIRMIMHSSIAPDDSKFSGIAALGNGCILYKSNGVEIFGYGNYKTNKDFVGSGCFVEYTDKAGGGDHSTRVSIDLQVVYGQVIRLDPRNNEEFYFIERDDLTGLELVTVSIMGSYTVGE